MVLYILKEVEGDDGEFALHLAQAYDQDGYYPAILGEELLDREYIERLSTQTPLRHPTRAEYCDKVFEYLSRHARADAAIILTRAWHREVFRGLDRDGSFRGMTIVEILHERPHRRPEPASSR